MSVTIPGGTGDALRQRNLSTVLRLVARHGPLTRSDLAKRTGLNRSTVGVLVAELTEFGFVGETYPEVSQGMGRPSSVVSVNDRVVAVAVRPTSTAVAVALVGLGGVVHRLIQLPLDHVPSAVEAVNLSAAMIEGLRIDLSGSMRMVGIGAALPGLVQQRDGSVVHATALGWMREDFSAALAAATHLPVLAANEAQLGVMSEVSFGVVQEMKDVLYLTSGPNGTAAGVFAGGAPLRGTNGYAGDIGHVVVVPGGAPCACGQAGCLAVEIDERRLLAAVGAGTSEELTGALELPLAPAAETEIARQLDLAALALTTGVRFLDPEVIVLAGRIGALHDLRPDRVPGEMARLGSSPVPVVRSTSTMNSLMLGAGQLAFTELLNNPSVVASRLSQLAKDSKHWSRQRFNPAVFHRPED